MINPAKIADGSRTGCATTLQHHGTTWLAAAVQPGALAALASQGYRLLQCSAFLAPGTLAALPQRRADPARTWLVATGR